MEELIEEALELDVDDDIEYLKMQEMVEIHYGAAQQLYREGEDDFGDEHVEQAHGYAEDLTDMLEDEGYNWQD